MPHSTLRGPEDLAMLAACAAYAKALGAYSGDAVRRADAVLVAFNEAGCPVQIWIGGDLQTQLARVRADQGRHLFYDPFEGPEHTWVSWDGVPPRFFEILLAAAEARDSEVWIRESWPPDPSGAFMS